MNLAGALTREVIDYLNLVLQLGLLSAALMGVRKLSGMIKPKEGPDPVTPDDEKG